MHRTLTLVISTLLLLLVGCTGRGDATREEQAGDSIVTEAVTASTPMSMPTALTDSPPPSAAPATSTSTPARPTPSWRMPTRWATRPARTMKP